MNSIILRDLLRNVTSMLTSIRLAVLHIVLNAVLLAAAAAWLLIPEGHAWQLIAAALSALVILFVFLWLHAGTLAYALNPVADNFRTSFSVKTYRLLWVLLGAFVLSWCMYTIDRWTDSRWQIGGFLYSKAPSFLRPTSGPESYDNAVGYCLSILFWYLLPASFLPLICARLSGGTVLRGLRALKHWQYWLAMAIVAFVGVWIPLQILDWIPGKTLEAQTTGLVIRLLLVYLLAIGGWLAAAGTVGYFVRDQSSDETVPHHSPGSRIVVPGGTAQTLLLRCLSVVRQRKLVAAQVFFAIAFTVVSRINSDTLGLEQVWRTIAAISTALLLLVAFLWLYTAAMVFAANPEPTRLRSAFEFRIGRMSWLLLGLVALVLLTTGVEWLLWQADRGDRHVWLISRTTDLSSDYLIPCLLLPLAMAKVGAGRSLREGLRTLRRWQYWGGMAVIVFVASWLSNQFAEWHLPRTELIITARQTLSNLPLVIAAVAAAGLAGFFVGSGEPIASTNVLRQSVS